MTMNKRDVCYVSSDQFVSVCGKHPKIKLRSSLVDDLLNAYNLKKEMRIISPTLASKQDLLTFHTEEFVECLGAIDKYFKENPIEANEHNNSLNTTGDLMDISGIAEEIECDILAHGFGYDCEIFPEVFEYVKYVTGATLTAATLLMDGEADLAVNLNGGWHHAHIDEVAGFCYANDIVVGILHLMKKFKRILYVDLDVHHGDGVEEAFKYSKKVVTFSIHKYVQGYFPGTGNVDDVGSGGGQYHSVNIPLKDGIRDEPYQKMFNDVFFKILQAYKPEVIVCQCGTDMLSGDPLGGFNLTSKGLISCVETIYKTSIPLMLLGGGGYHLPNAARCWTELVAFLVGKDLDDNIPEHDNLEMYGPDFSLHVSKSNRKDENTEEYLSSLLDEITENIQAIGDGLDVSHRNLSSEVVNKENQFVSPTPLPSIDLKNTATVSKNDSTSNVLRDLNGDDDSVEYSLKRKLAEEESSTSTEDNFVKRKCE